MDRQQILHTARIMIIAKDGDLRQVLMIQFERKGVMALEQAETMLSALEKIKRFDPDILLVDFQLQDGNAPYVCERLREQGFTKPIIILTDQHSKNEGKKSLDAGANDYIAKPMHFGELVARIRTQLRQHRALSDSSFSVKGLKFIPADKSLTCGAQRKTVILTEKETMILKKLFQSSPRTISRAELLSQVWGYNDDVTTHTLETHIYRLRQKINSVFEEQLIKTNNKGYSLNKDIGPDAKEANVSEKVEN